MTRLLSFALLVLDISLSATATSLVPLTTRVFPRAASEITAKPVPKAKLMNRDVGDWIEVCPTPGATAGCDHIAIHDVISEPNGGHYIPACNSNNDCQYIGYVEPTDTIVGSTSYQLHTSEGESYIVPVPIVLPPGEPVPGPPPPLEPDTPDAPEDTTTTTPLATTAASSSIGCSDSATTTVSVSLDDDWFTSGIAEW